jgi:glyceraldehyde 3-phosphate dehydrogenase
MTVKVGVNGFGRMGRLILRAAWGNSDIEFVQINDPAGDAATLAHLLTFDSVHGRWDYDAVNEGKEMVIDGRRIACTTNANIADTDWSGCDVGISGSEHLKI